MMDPVMEALTSSSSPARTAAMVMMSSAALPRVALSSAPSARVGVSSQVFGGLADVGGQRNDPDGGEAEDGDRRPSKQLRNQRQRQRQQQQ